MDLKHKIKRELAQIEAPDLWERILAQASPRTEVPATADRSRRPQVWGLVAAAAVAAILLVAAMLRPTGREEVDTTPADQTTVPQEFRLPAHMEFGEPPEGQGIGTPPGGGLNEPAGEGLGGATMDLEIAGSNGELSGQGRIDGFSYFSTDGGNSVVLEFECFETDATDLILGAVVTESTGGNPGVGDRIAVLIREGRMATVWWSNRVPSCAALLDAVPYPRPDDRFVQIIERSEATTG